MPKAHIHTADGAKITIEGSAAEIASIIKQIQSSGPPSKAARRISKAAQQTRDRKRRDSASDRVTSLKEEGFFNQPKVTTLSGVMLGLVQRRLLTRVKKEGIWVYGKR